MGLPPTPEPSGMGLGGTPPSGRGMRGLFGRNRPMISIDPQIETQLRGVIGQVRALKEQMQGVATAAERYSVAMGGAAGAAGTRMKGFQQPMTRPGEEAARRAGGIPLRPPGMPDPDDTKKPGAGRSDGGITRTQLWASQFAPQILQMFRSQLGNVMDRERVTSRLAMAQGGRYFGPAQGGTFQDLGRSAFGYSNTSDLYGGMRQLGRMGLMNDPNDPRTRQLMRQTGQLAIMGGTNFSGAANAVSGFMAPQTVNALMGGALGRSINASPGGRFQMFNEDGRTGLMEQMFQAVNRGRRGEATERFFRTGLRPGSPLAMQLQSAGFSEDQQEMLQQYGIMRGEGKNEGDIRKRFTDAGEEVRQFKEVMSDLVDSLSDTVLPILTAFAKTVTPVVDVIGRMTGGMNTAEKALIVLAGAATWAARAEIKKAALSGLGLGGEEAILGRGGQLATKFPRVGGFLGKAVGPVAVAGGGIIAGGAAQSAIGGEEGSARNVLGGTAGGALRGAGTGFMIGSALGAIGGPLAGVTGAGGAAVGAVIGGTVGFIKNVGDGSGVGDPLPGYSDKDLLAHPPPAIDTPGGGPLPGRGNSAHLSPGLVERLQAMFAANPKLVLNSGWRSHEEQAYLRWQLLTGKRTKAVARVGESRHETGLAADIGPESQYNWLREHAHEFGLANVGAAFGEAWHYEAAGGGVAPAQVPSSGGRGGAAPAGPTTAASPTHRTITPTKTATPTPVRSGGGGMEEVDIIAAFWSGGGGAGGSVGSGGDTGDAVSMMSPMYGGMSGGSGGSITIHKVEITVKMDRGTPEEADRAARQIGQLLSDRDRLLALAKGA